MNIRVIAVIAWFIGVFFPHFTADSRLRRKWEAVTPGGLVIQKRPGVFCISPGGS